MNELKQTINRELRENGDNKFQKVSFGNLNGYANKESTYPDDNEGIYVNVNDNTTETDLPKISGSERHTLGYSNDKPLIKINSDVSIDANGVNSKYFENNGND